MQSIITSYLVQTGKCALPYIGIFNTESKPAASDPANRQILPPTEEIVFAEKEIPLAHNLTMYAALKKNISENDAAVSLNNFCKEWKHKIDSGETMYFETLGKLSKNEKGNIIFSGEKGFLYNQPVPAELKLRENTGHTVLVGDNETTSMAMNDFYNREPVVKKNAWRTRALVLLIISLLLLWYSFYNRNFSPSTIGNRSNFDVASPADTHFGLSR